MKDKIKLTLANLLDRKSKQDKMGLSTFYLESLDANLPIVKIKTRKLCEIMDKYEQGTEKFTPALDMMAEIVYKCVPMLKDKDLQKQLDVPTPYEVVGELFTFSELEKITQHILEIHGMKDKDKNPVNDEIKN